ncbi:MAG TPA: ATP-binding cassette domain-containing protein [Anaerolineaceae bacterium]|nr:ATP-binding cassette domain-containing protein [Anaerolineaceae bacterium]
MEPIIHIENVYKSFGQVQALKGVSLDVNKGEVVVIIGPSGSGKSTLLRCINRLEEFDRGPYRGGWHPPRHGTEHQRRAHRSWDGFPTVQPVRSPVCDG